MKANEFKEGMVLCATWHYSMVIPQFYVVLRNTGKTIIAQEVGHMIVEHDGYGQEGRMVPDLSKTGKKETRRIDKWGEVRLGGALARAWNGQPVSFDYYD